MLIVSPVISKASGSLAGITAAHNKSGIYFRQRSSPVNPNTAFQQVVRNSVTTLSTRWSNVLTQAQRDGWAVYAANQPLINKVGEAKLQPPISMYIRSNSPRIQAGLSTIDDAPTTFVLPSFTVTGVTASEATQNISVAYTAGDDWEDLGGALLVKASRPQSVGIVYFKGPYRFANSINGAAIPPVSPQTVPAPFAFLQGHKLFAQIRATNPDGRLSSAQQFSFIAGA